MTPTASATAAAAQVQAASMISDQQAMIFDAFRGQVYITDQLDVQDTPLYDTITYAASASITTSNSQLFTNVGSASNKTYVQTNLTQQQKLTAPEAFSVFGLRFYWDSEILRSDLDNILRGFVLEFWMVQKYYQRAPLWHFASGGGIWGFSDKSGESSYSNGIPSIEAMHVLKIPLVIGNQLAFWAQLFGTTLALSAAGSGFIGVCELVGLYARAVM